MPPITTNALGGVGNICTNLEYYMETGDIGTASAIYATSYVYYWDWIRAGNAACIYAQQLGKKELNRCSDIIQYIRRGLKSFYQNMSFLVDAELSPLEDEALMDYLRNAHDLLTELSDICIKHEMYTYREGTRTYLERQLELYEELGPLSERFFEELQYTS